ncbi:MAG: protein kinase [Holophagales bacterium]|nr:protein kinase [Holophagales bacterium]
MARKVRVKGSARPSRMRGAPIGALALLVALVCAAGAGAARPALRIYGVADGLKYSQVFCVAQDRDGMIWVGTSYGVSRYDGRKFESLTSRDGLSHDSVSALATAADGTVWAATQEGLARIAPAAGALGEPRVVPLPPAIRGIASLRPTLLAASPGALWLGDGKRVVRVAEGRADEMPFPPGFGPNVLALGPATDDTCWAGSEGGLALLSRSATSPAVLPIPPGMGRPVAFALDRDDLYVLFGRGLARLAGGTGPFQVVAEVPPEAEPNALVRLVDGWAIPTETRGLLLVREGRIPEWIGTQQGLPSASVSGAIVDRSGILWLATEAGLVKIFDLDLRSIPSRLPDLGGMVFTVAPAPGGRLWVGHTEGVSVVSGDTVRRIALGGSEAAVWTILPMEGESFLAGTPRGLIHVSPAGVRRFPDLPLAGPGRVFDLARGAGDTVWATTVDGVVRFSWDARTKKPRDPIPTTEIAGEPFGEARAIAVEDDGTAWIGTDGRGVIRWDGARFTRIGSEAGLPSGYSRVVLPTRGGLLIGTDRGLFRLEAGRVRPVDAVNRALDDPWIAALAEAGGDLWVATSYSLFRVKDGVVVERLDMGTGLVGASTTAESCLAPLPGDRLAVGMDGGLSLLDAGRPPRIAPPPAIAIAGVVDASGRAVHPGRAVDAGAASITFALRSPSYFSEERTLFSERLLPLESAFSPPHPEPRARYAGLAPGRYTLEAQALASSGLRSPRPARFHFTVEPPWWGTVWARGAMLLLLLAAVATVVRLRTRGLSRRAAALESRVEERTRELTETNARLEEAQARITQLLESRPEAQLDPASWASTVAAELARALGVASVGVFAFDERGTTTRLAGEDVPAPTRSDAEAAAPGAFLSPGEGALFPARGASGELLGAVAVPAGATWDESRRRLLGGFAHQLGGALEIRTVRRRLAEAESARETARAAMKSRGVVPAAVCPRCRRVYSEVVRCPDDGTPLDASRLLPAVIRDRYRLLCVLGEGGMGTVFLAEDLRLPREVAIKIVRLDLHADPGIRLRFVREANTLARLSHPGVTALFDAGELDDGSLFLVMERLRGRDLGSVLAKDGRGRPAQVAEVACQAGAALAAAHRAGVVHRDVKPENLVLTWDGDRLRVKVVDFGLARAPEAGRALTRTGMVVGTPAFMAPEQVMDEELSAATDLYALAAVVWEALTGLRLVKSEGVGGIFHEILTEEPTPPSLLRAGLPPEVDALVLSALAKAPGERPQDVEAWGSRLAAALSGVPPAEAGWSDAGSAAGD